jgi:hypothetical protein
LSAPRKNVPWPGSGFSQYAWNLWVA